MCKKQISTQNGVLTCDLEEGHEGYHHALHPGGTVPHIDRHKSKEWSPLTDDKGEYLAAREVAPLEIEWPQEAPVEGHRTGADTHAARDRAEAKAKLGGP